MGVSLVSFLVAINLDRRVDERGKLEVFVLRKSCRAQDKYAAVQNWIVVVRQGFCNSAIETHQGSDRVDVFGRSGFRFRDRRVVQFVVEQSRPKDRADRVADILPNDFWQPDTHPSG